MKYIEGLIKELEIKMGVSTDSELTKEGKALARLMALRFWGNRSVTKKLDV